MCGDVRCPGGRTPARVNFYDPLLEHGRHHVEHVLLGAKRRCYLCGAEECSTPDVLQFTGMATPTTADASTTAKQGELQDKKLQLF
jgi:hypothetical protein